LRTISSLSTQSLSDGDAPIALDDAVSRLIALDDDAARAAWIAQCVQTLPMDELAPRLRDVSGRYIHRDPRLAMRLADALIFAADLGGRKDYHALGLISRGTVLGALGRYEEVIAVMDEAAERYRALGDEVGWAKTRKEWLRSAHRLGWGEQALPEADRARKILEEHQVWDRAATFEYCIAVACADLGRHEEALARYDHALAMYRLSDLNVELYIAQMQQNQAFLLTQLGDFQRALELFEEIRPVFHRYDQTMDVIRQAANVAVVHAAQGHYTRALRAYNTALEGYQRADLNQDIANVRIDMLQCYFSLNRDGDALELAEETIAHADRYGIRTEAAQARFYCALAHARLGNRERALEMLTETEHTATAANLSTILALITLQRALLYLEDAQWALAEQQAEHASAQFTAIGQPIRAAQADLVQGQAVYARDDFQAATRFARSALATSRTHDVPWLAPEAHHILGNVARIVGDLPAALGAYDDAVASIERVQSAQATELRTHFLADKVRIYDDAIAVCLRLGEIGRAFSYLERAKSRALVDYLASNLEVSFQAPENADPEVVATLTRLREEHNWFYNRLYSARIGGAADGGLTLSDDALREAIRERERKIGRLLERLILDRTEGFAFSVAPVSATLPTLPTLSPGTVLLEYYLAENASAVFVVSEGEVAAIPLPVRPTEIVRLLNQWELNLSATARMLGAGLPLNGLETNARGILGMLHRALLTPVAAYLAECERVIIVPHGPTHAAPFHALYDGTSYLLERMAVAVCPSSNLLRICTERLRRPGRSAFVMAYSDGGRLPAVCEEARAIAALLPGQCLLEEAATRATLAASASHHNVVHLAAHGEARLDNPTFAHLKLADGQLTMVDIFNLRLQGALVTLSACQTGRSVVAGGDELIGLSRGFLYAGAATLVQSLWRVEDGSTARLMEQFYRGISTRRTKGEALREAQRAMLSTSGTHPYFWAPFQLIGDDGPL
jgi:CHAT domain-containing protein